MGDGCDRYEAQTAYLSPHSPPTPQLKSTYDPTSKQCTPLCELLGSLTSKSLSHDLAVMRIGLWRLSAILAMGQAADFLM